jgi:hypothetical protein
MLVQYSLDWHSSSVKVALDALKQQRIPQASYTECRIGSHDAENADAVANIS